METAMNATSVTTKRPEVESDVIDPRVRIGHIHLRVSDLERSLAFYCNVLGFELTGRLDDEAAFLSAGGYHHHFALNTWQSRGGVKPAPGSTGLHHVAILYPDRAALAAAHRRVVSHRVAITGASDHGGSEAIYLDDPDGNGIELTWDRPRHEWPRLPDGRLMLVNRPLDLEDLAAA
jgi:catechol 2,3-dioxygenase